MHPLKRFGFLLVCTAILLSPLSGQCASTGCLPNDTIKNQYAERAKAHAERLLSIQKKSNHLWKRAIWWNNANILESLIDYHRLTGKDFSKEMHIIFKRNLYNIQTRYVSPISFDDNEWWAISWLKAYEMTGDQKYLAVSEHIFHDMINRSWDTVCGGGMKWQYSRKRYKNAVTNELFIVLAARLALDSKDSAGRKYYLGWALKEWQWFRNSHLFTDSLWISDGLHKDCSCVVNQGLDLTYNQGIVLGGLTYLYQLTSDRAYLQLAQKMAYASMKKYSNGNGILTEYGGPDQDRIQFKGIYMRYLAILNTELHDEQIKQFILHNADHVWLHCRSSDGFCDYDWNGPFKIWNGASQGSTMDLMNAALMQK